MARSAPVTGVRLRPGTDAHAMTTAGAARLQGAGNPVFLLTFLSVGCVPEETNPILPLPPVLEVLPGVPVLTSVCRGSFAPSIFIVIDNY